MIVVSDTSPLNYLVLIGHEWVLPRLFGSVLTAPRVIAELNDVRTPERVRAWIRNAPAWLDVRTPRSLAPSLVLDEGEREAISLALEVKADVVLIDERAGTLAATSLGLFATGTLGVLRRAAGDGLLDFEQAIRALRTTTFRLPREYR